MEDINFITVGDKNFFLLICYLAKLIKKFYKNSMFYIYDWGFTYLQKKILKSYPNSILIDWTSNLDFELGYKNLKINKTYYGNLERTKKLEYLFIQKPLCLLDCAKRVKKNLIYLDGDAFLINNIDEIFKNEYDIGVTIRINDRVRLLEKKLGIKAYINAGVIFFNTNSENIQLFIREWLKEIEFSSKIWLEQTALNNLVARSDQNIFKKYYNKGKLKIKSKELKIMTFPYIIYNNYEIKRGFNPKKTKILHYRISHKKLERDLLKEIILGIKLGVFYHKFLNLFPKLLHKYICEIFNLPFIVNFIINPFKLKNWLDKLIEPLRDYYNFKKNILNV